MGQPGNRFGISFARAHPTAFSMLFLLLVTSAVFWRHLFADHTFPWTFIATSRWAVFVTNTVGSGHFTEWIPFVGGGMPISEAAISGLYYPVWWLAGALHIPPTITNLTIFQVAHVFLAGAGGFALARSYALARPWALLAATAYVFFGGIYGNASHDVILRGHAYAPWLLWTLTVPRDGGPWRRILALPFVVWVLATGSYAGQAVAFLQVGAVYAAAELWRARNRLRELGPYAVAAFVATAAVMVAIYLPFVSSSRAGELFRPYPPTAQERSIWALNLLDLLGLYLNPFAWRTVPSTIAAWSVGVVVLIGVACLSKKNIRSGASLIAAGLVATALAMLPSWPPAGRILAASWLSPSRLPASDYKAMAAVALVCMGAIGWSRIAGERPGPAPALVALIMLASLPFAPQMTQVSPVKLPLLVAGVVLCCAFVAYRGNRLPAVLVFATVLLLAVTEGARTVYEMEMLPGVSPWSTPGKDFPERALQDAQASNLRNTISTPPRRRPARIPDVAFAVPDGDTADTVGFLGTVYNMGDYGGTITIARHRIRQQPRLYDMMLRPWTPWVWTCKQVDCNKENLPAPGRFDGHESNQIVTTSYGLSSIHYRVSLTEKSLMVENEIASSGWTADHEGVRYTPVAGALRGWVLPAGEYEFTASYVQPERQYQIALVVIALCGFAVSCLLYRRRQRH